jgi:adenylyltransferase/sulfurtransferase
MQSIDVFKLKSMIDSGLPHQIIDIREYHEVESGNIEGLHIPMAEILDRCTEIRRDVPVVMHCKSGARAQAAIHALEVEKGFNNLIHLEGGIEAWAREINPELVVY